MILVTQRKHVHDVFGLASLKKHRLQAVSFEHVLNLQTKSLDLEFKVCVAIDFGTDGIGVAYAYDRKVQVHDKWKSKNYGTIVKPKTIILFNDKFKVANVGLDAKHTYINLSKKKDTWMLFERFKMSLFGMY